MEITMSEAEARVDAMERLIVPFIANNIGVAVSANDLVVTAAVLGRIAMSMIDSGGYFLTTSKPFAVPRWVRGSSMGLPA